MFKLLEIFAETKNAHAPTIFKNIANSFIENLNDHKTREFLIKNLISIFKTIQSIPVSFIVEPLMSHIKGELAGTYEYNTIDFDLFLAIAKHKKLTPRHALLMLDYLGELYLNDFLYMSTISVIYMELAARFQHQDAVKEYLIEYLTRSITMLLSFEKPPEDKKDDNKNAKVKVENLNNVKKKEKILEKKKAKEEAEAKTNSLKRTSIIEIARKIQNLNNDDINHSLRVLCLATNKRSKELFKKLNIGLLVLMKYWGDPKALTMKYIDEEEEKERKIKEEHEKKIAAQKEEERKRLEEKKAALAIVDADLRGDIGSRRKLNRGGRSSGQLVPYSKTPYDKIGKKAMIEIDKIKLSLKEKEELKRNEEKLQSLKIERQKRALKKKLDKRMIEHGVNYRNETTTAHNIIFQDGEVEYNKIFDSHIGLPPIELIELEEEENRDVQAVQIFMKKYSKLWRFLFKKYANM